MIIGLVGFIGAGKNTAAMFYEQKGFRKIAFADKLKDVLSVVFGWDRTLLEGETKESREFRETVDPYWSTIIGEPITPRLMMQRVGTDAFRKLVHTDIWVHALEREILEHPDTDFIIPDVRFMNEANMVRSNSGKIYHIQRGPLPEWFGLADAANSDTFTHAPECYKLMLETGVHESEWSWVGTKLDRTYHNNSDINTLYQQLEADM